MPREFSNLAKVVIKRTYARKDNGYVENWAEIVQRYVAGNVRGHNVPESEIQDLLKLGYEGKAIPGGRGLWFSGTKAHELIGGQALCNCWGLTINDWYNYVVMAELLMLGGGVGISVEHKYVSKLPKIKKAVVVTHKSTKDADFIVPDSREGWCELLYRTLEAHLVKGKSFTYSTICVRGYGEPIHGFGGTSSGPIPLIQLINNINGIMLNREGRHLRPIDAADIGTAIGEMVVSGNVRRSAIIIQGDCWDKEYLQAKRWDLYTLPSYRSCANYSVVCDDAEDLHPLYWKTFEAGEAYGLINIKATQKYGRMGELKKDTAVVFNPCGESSLESFEMCNLQEIALPNLNDLNEFILAARLMHRYGKRVTMEDFHHNEINDVVKRNRRIGTSITGCLAKPSLYNPGILDKVYEEIQKENTAYSKELGIPESIRTTLGKPSGSVSKVLDMMGYEGMCTPAWSRYIKQRIRISTNDSLIPLLKEAGHYMEPVKKFDGTLDLNTLVVDFYQQAPDGMPVADENFDTWDQLKVHSMAQKHWADQAVSVSVYYKKEEIPKIKEWVTNNINNIKTISFLAHSGHGYLQAPKEAITKEQFEQLSSKIKPIDFDRIGEGKDLIDNDCDNGVCPIK